MASEVRLDIKVNDNGSVELTNFANTATRELKRVEDSGNSMGAGFAGTWAGMAVGLNQGIELFEKIAHFAEEPIKAYMESETALLKMGMAMKNQGDFSKEALADMEEYAAQIQKTTAYEDDATLAVMAKMKTFGMSNEQVKEATQAALDMSSATGKSIEDTAQIMGKSYLGITKGLQGVGIQIDSTAPKAELFNSVLKQVEARFGGSAQAELLTYAGQWKQMHNQWKDTQEFLGLVFLKTIEGVHVTVGLLGVSFLTAGNAILGILRIVMLPITTITNGLAYLNELAGKTEAAAGLRAFGSAIENAQGSIVAAREDMLKYTSKNYDAMIATNKVADAIEKMGKQGQRTKPILDDVTKGMAKSMLEIIKQQEEGAKLLYETQVKGAESAAKAAQDAGQLELTTIQNKFDTETGAAYDYYSTMYDLAWQKVETEKKTAKAGYDEVAVFNAMVEKLDIQYDKSYQEKLDAKNQAVRDWAKKNLEVEAGLYKALPEYSSEAAAADIANLNKRYLEYSRFTTDTTLLEKAKAEEIRKIELKKAEYSDDFFEGVTAGLKDLEAQQTHWGKVGIDTVKSFSKNAQSTMSSVFFDAYKGNLKSASEYFTSFTDSMMKTFLDTLSKMIVEAGTKRAVKLVFDAEWSSGSGPVLGAIGKILGYAADWFGSTGTGITPDSNPEIPVYSASNPIPRNYNGGWIRGYAYGGNSPANDTVLSWLSPGEYVVDRESIQAIASMGKHGDTMLAHINPAEASLLMALGGAGTVNERTGLLQFHDAAVYENSGEKLMRLMGYMIEDGRVFSDLMDANPNMWTFFPNDSIPAYNSQNGRQSFGTFLINPSIPGQIYKVAGMGDSYSIDDNGTWKVANYGGVGSYTVPFDGTWFDNYRASHGLGYDSSSESSSGLSSIIDIISTIGSGGFSSITPYISGEEGTWWHDQGIKYLEPLGSTWSNISKIWKKGGTATDVLDATWSELSDVAGAHYYFNKIGESLSNESRNTAALIASIMAPYGIGGAMAADLKGETGLSKMIATALNGLSTYLGGTVDYGQGTEGTTTTEQIANQVTTQTAKSYLSKIVMDTVQGLFSPGFGKEGSSSMSYSMSGGPDLSSLGSFPNKLNSTFAFSAKNGLDYVPEDNFLINAHKGEKLLTAEEREDYVNSKKLLRDLLSEITGFRNDMQVIGYTLAKNTQKTTKLLEKFDAIGMPPERALLQ